jgi:hypothetical protein
MLRVVRCSLLLALVGLVLAGCASPSARAEPKEPNACAGVVSTLDVTVTTADDPNAKLTFDGSCRCVVLIDGEVVAQINGTPTTVTIPPGRHRVSIEADGYQPWDDNIDVQPGTRVTVHARR